LRSELLVRPEEAEDGFSKIGDSSHPTRNEHLHEEAAGAWVNVGEREEVAERLKY
jgi:hypothetical protein